MIMGRSDPAMNVLQVKLVIPEMIHIQIKGHIGKGELVNIEGRAVGFHILGRGAIGFNPWRSGIEGK
jgi:hypothetical protein